MLIKALCEYYDILSRAGKVLPDGYSNVRVHYLISLTEDGDIDEIIDFCKIEEVPTGKNKTKQKRVPKEVLMPQRTDKPAIEANIVDHRPLYIFGLNAVDGEFTSIDETNKANYSHKAFVEANLHFLENLDSPIIHAFRNFLLNWEPEKQTGNRWLLSLLKDYEKSSYAFCLSGNPDKLLHEDLQLKQKWEKFYKEKSNFFEDDCISQCAITGEKASIARIHNKIKGVYGGSPMGGVLIGFNNPSECSYGYEQSYNSNISEMTMKKYTETLNYLLSDKKHKVILDEMTVVFWAMNNEESCEDLFLNMFFGKSEQMNADMTESMLKSLLEAGKSGNITEERLQSLNFIESNVDFYIVGIKPNASRISVKFIARKKYAEFIQNIVKFQRDVLIGNNVKPVFLFKVKDELVPPKKSSKSEGEKVNPILMTKLLESVLYGTNYPVSLLETLVRRVKIDNRKQKINSIRAGLIKACINRNYSKKEELKMALDESNNNQAYLCGRLFAILEKIQQDASNTTLNRTIKDAYFASAIAKPVLVFPKIMKLAQNHLSKVKSPIYYNNLICEIMNKLTNEFPESLSLADQGRFIIGYYQENQKLYEKKEKNQKEEEK